MGQSSTGVLSEPVVVFFVLPFGILLMMGGILAAVLVEGNGTEKVGVVVQIVNVSISAILTYLLVHVSRVQTEINRRDHTPLVQVDRFRATEERNHDAFEIEVSNAGKGAATNLTLISEPVALSKAPDPSEDVPPEEITIDGIDVRPTTIPLRRSGTTDPDETSDRERNRSGGGDWLTTVGDSLQGQADQTRFVGIATIAIEEEIDGTHFPDAMSTLADAGFETLRLRLTLKYDTEFGEDEDEVIDYRIHVAENLSFEQALRRGLPDEEYRANRDRFVAGQRLLREYS